jgi:magnesium-transporting ATPase (P-type)
MLLTAAVLIEYASRLSRGEPYARSGAMVVIILGSLWLMWAELAGDRPWWKAPAPHRATFWIVTLLITASLPIFMAVGPISVLLQIEPITLGDWLIARALALVPPTLALRWYWHSTRSVRRNRTIAESRMNSPSHGAERGGRMVMLVN